MTRGPARAGTAGVHAADVGLEPPGPVLADGLTYDRAAAVRHLRQSDPSMALLVDAAGPFTVEPDVRVEPFAYLLRSIVYQQLHGAAAARIHGRLLDLFDGAVPSPRQLLSTDAATLRSAGVSAGKAASMHDLARHALDETLPGVDELPGLRDEEIVRRLTVVRGIGPWTVHMLLLFHLGRPDVLPTGDFAVREGHRLLRGEARQPTPGELRARAQPWRPYRSVASWYLWRAVHLSRAGVDVSNLPGQAPGAD